MTRPAQTETQAASSARTVDLMRAVWTGENIRAAPAFAASSAKITLWPNAPGQPVATERTGDVDFAGQQIVVLVLDVPHVQGSPVVFEVDVIRPDGSVALAARATVGAGRRRALRAAAAEPLRGPHDIVLRTLLLPPGKTAWTWAQVLSFEVVSPGVETDAEHAELPAVQLLGPAAAEAPSCLICGGRTFGRAQSGRLSRLGNPPRCLTCGSVERHRIIRSIFEAIPADRLAAARALQFSPETVVQPAAFARFEISVYGGHNSLDLMRIDRPDASYDWVLANHVLEHVPDDATALREILRILAPDGIAEITVPDTTGSSRPGTGASQIPTATSTTASTAPISRA